MALVIKIDIIHYGYIKITQRLIKIVEINWMADYYKLKFVYISKTENK